MTEYPEKLLELLKAHRVTVQEYERWVCRHEAAHAVVALHHRMTLKRVDLTPQLLHEAFSRARAEWDPDGPCRITHQEVLEVIMAGTALDRACAPQLSIPEDLANRCAHDKKTAEDHIKAKLPKLTAPDKAALAVNRALEGAGRLVGDAELSKAIESLGDALYEAMANGAVEMAGTDICKMVAPYLRNAAKEP